MAIILNPEGPEGLLSVEQLQEIKEKFLAGEIIALPTETVYGLAALASCDDAVRKIYQLKKRPESLALILHIRGPADLDLWADKISTTARLLATSFWPGHLTLILKKKISVSKLITGGRETVAIRAPNHPIFQQILTILEGKGIVAPSANLFTKVSPTIASDVAENFVDESNLIIIDGGSCQVGIESTILDAISAPLRITRTGMITSKEIQKVIGSKDKIESHTTVIAGECPGTHKTHYQPKTPLLYLSFEEIQRLNLNNIKVALVLKGERELPKFQTGFQIHSLPENPSGFANGFYKLLYKLDRGKYNLIVIYDNLGFSEEWQGIRDRIKRASS